MILKHFQFTAEGEALLIRSLNQNTAIATISSHDVPIAHHKVIDMSNVLTVSRADNEHGVSIRGARDIVLSRDEANELAALLILIVG